MATGTIENPRKQAIIIYKQLNNITIPANSTYTFDFTDDIPSGYWMIDVSCRIDTGGTPYPIPYINSSGNVSTWFSRITSTTAIVQNNTSAWTNSTCYFAITCVAS